MRVLIANDIEKNINSPLTIDRSNALEFFNLNPNSYALFE